MLTITRLIQGYRVSEAIFVAAKLGIADLIAGGLRNYIELARATDTHPPSLYRLLRYLATLGLLKDDEAGNFALTQVEYHLTTANPYSESSFARLYSEPWFQQPWNNLLYSVKTGETAFHYVHGMELFQYLAQHPEKAAVFNDAMSGGSAHSSKAIVSAYDFSKLGVIVDVGGGHGRLIIEILKANPATQGILFERPEVAEGARKEIEASGLERRCKAIAGDFFKEVTSGGNVYILRQIIHDWDDETCVKILKNIRCAIPPEGKLLLAEAVLPDHMDESLIDQVSTSYDINMLVITGGRERTVNEFRRIFKTAGFELTRIVPTEARDCILEATPV